MRSLLCPNCRARLERSLSPELKTDKCFRCNSVFLDKNELNSLATETSGDIEYCSLEVQPLKSGIPIRNCPHCTDQEMRKINILRLSSIMFDYCANCEGLFLDRRDMARVKVEDVLLAPDQRAKQFQGSFEGFRIRVDIANEVIVVGNTLSTTSGAPESTSLRISVYFRSPLNLRLHVCEERWAARLTRALGLYKAQDLQVAVDENFDRIFIVRADNEDGALNLLTPAVCAELVSFVTAKPVVYSRAGALEITDSALNYTEGPYLPEQVVDPVGMSQGAIQRLLKLAFLMDGTQGT